MSRLQDISAKVLAGTQIQLSEADELYSTAPLELLGQLAHAVRQRVNPGQVVTYLVDRNINYTNVCNTDCQFCGFYRPSSDHPEAYVLSREVLGDKIAQAIALGATRILLQGGHNDALPFSYYTDLIAWIDQNYAIEINAFSPSEVEQMHKISGLSYVQILTELKAAGLAGLPGGGAEILDDEIRKRVSPRKTSAAEWIHIMQVAHDLDLTTTATMVIGFGEEQRHRMNHLNLLRQAQDRAVQKNGRGFNAFISWTLMYNENTSLGRSKRALSLGVGEAEYLRNLAVARIFLDNIPHHQSSWPTLGGGMAARGLNMGCDDIGSTMIEENVVSKAGAPTKEKWSMSPAELRTLIRAAGFIPAQRNSSFEVLKIFERGDEVDEWQQYVVRNSAGAANL